MKAALERWLLARWYGARTPGFVLRGLAAFNGAVVALRSAAYARGWLASEKLPVPVIVIGNFTAGGTGKTPLVIALAAHFVGKGFKPGVVSRGHGRRSRGPVRVTADMPASECGDEPLLVARRTGVPVQVDSDRVRAAKALIDAGCNLIIADDGLQHRRLARDIEIEVRDGERGLGNGLLLPAGPLRERPRPLDFRVINGGTDHSDGDRMQLVLSDARLLDGSESRALEEFRGQPVHVVAGIGHPARFFNALRVQGLDVIEHAFPDHHPFQVEDFRVLEGPVLMTEKDAVKCFSLGLRETWYVPVEALLSPSFYDRLDARIAALPRG